MIRTISFASLLAVGSASADMLNLATTTYNSVAPSSSGSFTTPKGTVEFNFDDTQPLGSGVFQSFLRIEGPSNGGTEQGYNTDGAFPFETQPSHTFSHDVLMQDLTYNPDTGNYEFLLDINEPGANKKSLISLDGVRLYATNTPAQTDESTDGNGDWSGPSDALLLWDMDELTDNWILLDYNRGSGGSGAGDMQMVVSADIIDAGASYSNFILWSRFGLNETAVNGSIAEAGYEEWGQVYYADGGTPGGGPSGGVPVPGPLALVGLGALLMARKKRQGPQAE